MPARRLISTTTLPLLFIGLLAAPAMAQFTPRFSTQRKGPPVQWHIGIGGTVFNLGDHTNQSWTVLEAVVQFTTSDWGWRYRSRARLFSSSQR